MKKKQTQIENLGEKWDLAIAAIVILLAAFFVYDKVFKAGELTDEIANSEVSLDSNLILEAENLELNEEKSSIKSSIEEVSIIQNDSEIEVNSLDEPNQKNTFFGKPFKKRPKHNLPKKEEILSTKHIEEAIISSEIRKNNSTEIETSLQKDSDVENELSEKVILQNSIEENNKTVITDKVEENLTLDCTVVIGVFKEEVNKNKILEKLQKLGYQSNQGVMKNGLNYVGVPTTCNNDLQKRQLIKALNTQFNVETWVKNN